MTQPPEFETTNIEILSPAELNETDQDSGYSLFDVTGSVVSGAFGLMRFTTETAVHLAIETSRAAINASLDAVVPPTVNAIISRVDLTELVVKNVDIDALVARASIDPILDRIPMTEIADYVIEEIDLPVLVRQSTGGVADDLLSLVRFQAIETDNFVSGLVDRVMLRRKRRHRDINGGDDDARETDSL